MLLQDMLYRRWMPDLQHVLVSKSKVDKEVRRRIRTDVHVLVGLGGTGRTKPRGWEPPKRGASPAQLRMIPAG